MLALYLLMTISLMLSFTRSVEGQASPTCISLNITNPKECSAWCSPKPGTVTDQVAAYAQPKPVYFRHWECDCGNINDPNSSNATYCLDLTLLLDTNAALVTCNDKNITSFADCQAFCNTLGQQVQDFTTPATNNNATTTTTCTCLATGDVCGGSTGNNTLPPALGMPSPSLPTSNPRTSIPTTITKPTYNMPSAVPNHPSNSFNSSNNNHIPTAAPPISVPIPSTSKTSTSSPTVATPTSPTTASSSRSSSSSSSSPHSSCSQRPIMAASIVITTMVMCMVFRMVV